MNCPSRLFLEQCEMSAKWDSFIIGYDGTRYDKLAFDSSLHEQIVVQLRDPEKEGLIWKSYKRFIFSALKDHFEALKIFEEWLINHLFLLTCRQEDHLSELQSIPELSSFSLQLSQFFSTVACKEHSHFLVGNKEKERKVRKIVIITTSGAGGELMVANAIQKYLSSHDFNLFCIDADEVFNNDEDILYRFSGIYSTAIYGEVFQKENNAELAGDLWWKCDQMRRFIVDSSFRRLKERVRHLQPDLILSTRYFFSGEVALAYDLNIPLRFIHCDYRFYPDLIPLAKIVHSQLVKFWVPTQECIPTTLELKDKVEVLGYPIWLGIQIETERTQINLLKEKLGIKTGEKVLFMMMGWQGMGKVLLPLIKTIHSHGESLGPLHVAVVCGNNTSMKEEICEYLEEGSKSEQISFHIYGFLEEEVIGNYYNVTDVFLGKAGGATTAELIYMKIFCLIYQSYELEIPNLNQLIHLDLGCKLTPDLVVDQLKKLLQKDKNSIQIPQINWQERIQFLIESA